MKYRMKKSGAIVSRDELIGMHQNKVLPKVWKQSVFDDLEIDPILSTPQPVTTDLQTSFVSGCEQDLLGNWVETWTIQDKFSDIMDENGQVIKTKEEQEEEFIVDKNTRLVEAKKKSIREASELAYNSEVMDANGITWNGGFDSALVIDGKVRIAENVGLTEVTIYDASNQPHTLTLEEATMVAVTISAAYEVAYVAKQTAFTALDAIDLTQADISAELDAVEV